MILMPQFFDVIANENARYKRNELKFSFVDKVFSVESLFKILLQIALLKGDAESLG